MATRRARTEWWQQPLMGDPTALVTVEYSMHFDGPGEQVHFGYSLRRTDGEDQLAMGTIASVPLTQAETRGKLHVQQLVAMALRHLAPF